MRAIQDARIGKRCRPPARCSECVLLSSYQIIPHIAEVYCLFASADPNHSKLSVGVHRHQLRLPIF
jgi:hypothetical protein